GKAQTERLPVGSVQQHIFLWMLNELVVVRRFSSQLEAEIGMKFAAACQQNEESHSMLIAAGEKLSVGLGLARWQPPEPLTYVRRSSEESDARRLDSQYFAPHVTQLLAHLGKGGRTLRDVAPPRHDRFTR